MIRLNSTDIAIIGGGPAGSSTALALGQAGIHSTILERTTYDDIRIGETIPPTTRRLLTTLGLWESFLADKHIPSYATYSAWGEANLHQNDSIFNPYGSGWHLDRQRFDQMLATAVEERELEVIKGANVQTLGRNEKGWEIGLKHQGEILYLQANFIVDATGRSAPLTRKMGSQHHIYDKLIGLIGFLPFVSEANTTSQTLLLEAMEMGWWYSVPLFDGRLVAVFMSDFDLLQKSEGDFSNFWLGQLEASTHTKERLRPYQKPTKLISRAANTMIRYPLAGPDFVAVGDAAMAFDPLSSQGIYKALYSGIQAAQAITAYRSGQSAAFKHYSQKSQENFEQYLSLRANYYRLETRWPTSLFWQRRQQIDPQQTRITLNPMQTIYFEEQANTLDIINKLTQTLPFHHFYQLCKLSTTPILAHQVISAYKHNYGSFIDDQKIIVALQLLIEHSIVKGV